MFYCSPFFHVCLALSQLDFKILKNKTGFHTLLPFLIYYVLTMCTNWVPTDISYLLICLTNIPMFSKLPEKELRVNILGFAGHLVSTAATQLCCFKVRAALWLSINTLSLTVPH